MGYFPGSWFHPISFPNIGSPIFAANCSANSATPSRCSFKLCGNPSDFLYRATNSSSFISTPLHATTPSACPTPRRQTPLRTPPPSAMSRADALQGSAADRQHCCVLVLQNPLPYTPPIGRPRGIAPTSLIPPDSSPPYHAIRDKKRILIIFSNLQPDPHPLPEQTKVVILTPFQYASPMEVTHDTHSNRRTNSGPHDAGSL